MPPLLWGLCSLSVCINSTSASSQTSSSLSLCLIPLDKTYTTRPIAPETVAILLILFSPTGAFRWKSFSPHKVCLATVNSWKSGSNHFTPCRETVSLGPINTRRCPGECRLLGCFASSQTHNQLLSCSSPRGRQRQRARESNEKSEQFRQILTNYPDGINEPGDCASLFSKYWWKFLLLLAPPSRKTSGVEARWLETEACLFLSWVNIRRLRQPERDGRVEKLPTRMTEVRSEPLSRQPDSHQRREIAAAQTLQDRVQTQTMEPRFNLHGE